MLVTACRFVPMFSSIAHKIVPRPRFIRVLDCARISVVHVLHLVICANNTKSGTDFGRSCARLCPNFGRSRARLCPFSFAPCPFPNLAGTLTIYVNDNANQNNTPEQNVDITVQPIRNRIGSHKRMLHTPPHPLPPHTPHPTLYPLTPTDRLSPRLAWQSLPWIFFSPDVSSDLCPSSTSASSRSHPIGR